MDNVGEIEDNELESLEDLIAEANAEADGNQDDNSEDNSGEEEQDDSLDNDDSDNDDDNDDEDDSDSDDDEHDDNSQDDDSEDDEEDEKEKFEPITVDVNGVDVEIKTRDEMMSFIKKGAEGFKDKADTLANEKTIIEQGNLTADDLKLLVDAKNGNPKALAKLAEQGKVDLLDVTNDDAVGYTPEFQTTEPTDVEKVAQRIMANTELHQEFVSVSNKLPQDFINTITSNANDLATFGEHVRSGLAQKIIPEAIKLSLQGHDFAQAYVKIGTQMAQQSQQEAPQKKERNISERERNLRRKAKESSSQVQSKSKELTEDDVWNMSKEEFDEFTAKGN